ncbi:MAG: hypothetical protein JNJ49_11385 [Bdellovibrionaceae bacterium]|nr:hypothetical protein [Pseudobdellovibrionaceae bacterium]
MTVKQMFVFWAALFLCADSMAADEMDLTEPMAVTAKFDPTPRAYQVWLGPPLALAGFGIGQAVQGRYSSLGWVFTLTDVTAALWLFSTFGYCRNTDCVSRQNERGKNAVTLLAVSRLAQFVDSMIWSYGAYNKRQAGVAIVPTDEGLVLTAKLSF